MIPGPADAGAERALVERCARGEPGARETFAAAYLPVIRKAVRQVLGAAPPSTVDAESVVQQTLLNLLQDGARKLRTFDGRSRLSTWLTVVATRNALNAIEADPGRRLEREKRRGLAETLAWLKERPALPPDQVIREEDRARIRAVLGMLSERDRLLLRIIHEEGGTYSEAARILGVSPNSIGSLLERARSRFLGLASRHAPDLVRR